uniref:RNA helicase n=1 Tax=Globodera pallida TaxID=36090 RepID=A0A183CG26_GLOPA
MREELAELGHFQGTSGKGRPGPCLDRGGQFCDKLKRFCNDFKYQTLINKECRATCGRCGIATTEVEAEAVADLVVEDLVGAALVVTGEDPVGAEVVVTEEEEDLVGAEVVVMEEDLVEVTALAGVDLDHRLPDMVRLTLITVDMEHRRHSVGVVVTEGAVEEEGEGLAADVWMMRKNLYHEHASISRRSQADIDLWLTENECTLQGTAIPRSIFFFNESGFPDPIVHLLSVHYRIPTTIQSISWPVALSGRDLISIAKTGSGKTLGFILPAIVHTLAQPPRRPNEGPAVLVLLPTRELAIQVEEVAREYCRLMKLEATCCYGGAPKAGQANDLRKGIDICVATPGRILDFMEANTTNMRRCSFLVLDEADRMLDMGFEPQIRKIVGQIRPDRQSLMFSATWPKEVRTLAADFQENPVHLNVGSLELAANHNIQQHVEVLDEYSKQGRLFELLDHIMRQRDCKTLIFVETKRKADEITRNMRRDGWPALCIHGDKEQKEREWVLSEFKEGKTPILLATDVAARGLDVSDIKYVINFDYPNNSEDYVHRIGRTGRQEKTGTSYTFFTQQNAPKARDLIKVLEEAKQIIPDRLRELSESNFASRDKSKKRWRPVDDDGPSEKRGKPGDSDGFSGGTNSWAGSNGFQQARW